MTQTSIQEDIDGQQWHPSMGRRLSDGSIEYRIVGQYHWDTDGQWHREYAYWEGTEDWCADAGPQSSERPPEDFIHDFAEGFVADASDCFEEGQRYLIHTTLLTDASGVDRDVWAFCYSADMLG